MAWYLYMLRCGDGSLYTGITDDVQKRLAVHRAGKGAKYTRGRGPLELIYAEEQADKAAALRREIAIKQMTRQQKLELIRQAANRHRKGEENMKVSQIETPALIVERSAFESNMAAMSRLLEQTAMAFRPHYKSHKSIDVVRRQLAAGAKGITCAKLSEAEDLAQAGVGDILIANQVVQQEKLGRVAVLANKTRLTICVDHEQQVKALERAMAARGGILYVLVEYEIGMGRCGVETHGEVIRLAKLISEQPHLSFEGVQAYAGQLSHEVDLEVRRSASAAIEADLTQLKKELEAAGLPPKEISGGSTGTVELKPRDSVYTEMQCGSYLFMDRAYGLLDLRFENSLFLLTTVISTKPDRIVTDGGMKSLGMDQGAPIFVGYEELPVSMSEEHGTVEAPGHKAKMGDKLRYIPGHCCTTINMHDKLYLVDGEEVVDIWTVTSRGKSV